MIDRDTTKTNATSSVTANGQTVLSLFPGIDLFGRGFEAAGFCVVRGPDPIFGGDIRDFHAQAGIFNGIIGGPPCQDFSRARRSEPTGAGIELIGEFVRVVTEAKPTWWLMENVPGVPDVKIDGYNHLRIDLNSRDCGMVQSRHRHFQWGHIAGRVPTVTRRRSVAPAESQPCCLASEGQSTSRRSWADFCELQGLPRDFDLPGMTLSAKYRAVGNGVPVQMATVMAQSVRNAVPEINVRLCACGCGRFVYGKQISAGPACRKRMSRRESSIASTP
ncbi:MAG: hypothetical protein H6R15_195 [Proteobacteria bacterium]|nr:hypothetical protein [Pseudomonadota bacterium]